MLINAIIKKYGLKEGLTVSGYDIIEWPYKEAKPTVKELKALEKSYRASMQYKLDRELEYPSIEEQLDLIFHGGLDLWQSTIQKVKDKYPKPE